MSILNRLVFIIKSTIFLSLVMYTNVYAVSFHSGCSRFLNIDNKSGTNLYMDIVASGLNETYNFNTQQLDNKFQGGLVDMGVHIIKLKEGKNNPICLNLTSSQLSNNGRIYISTDPFSQNMSGVHGQPDLHSWPASGARRRVALCQDSQSRHTKSH